MQPKISAPAAGIERNRPRPVFSIGKLVSVVVVALIVLLIIEGLITNPNYRWDLVWDYILHPSLMKGIGYTLLLTVLSMAIGIVLALTMAIMRQSTNSVLRGVAWFYIWFFRGTPIYTQLLFWGLLPTLYQTISLGLPFGHSWVTFDTNAIYSAFWAAVLGLGLNEGAYLAEIVRSGLNSVDKGQYEAATALGMRRGLIMRRIIIPQAMRVIVPPTGNETISMLKTTSLVSAVPFTLELTYNAQALGRANFFPIPMLICAAIWYLLITSILMVGQYYLERYYGRGFDTDTGGAGKPKKGRAGTRVALSAGSETKTKFLDVTP